MTEASVSLDPTGQAPEVQSGIAGMYAKGREIDPRHVGPMRDSSDAADDPAMLWQRVNAEGYLYLPGLLDRGRVLEARRSLMKTLAGNGALKPGTDPMAGIANPAGTGPALLPEVAREDPALNRVLFDGPMIRLFEQFLDAEVRHFDFTWLRVVGPGHASASHCDAVYMGRGEIEKLFTVWTPLGDIHRAMGGLTVLEGSHRNERLKRTYGQYDVDTYCTNRPQITGWKHGGNLKAGLNQLRDSIGGRWRVTEFAAGDALLFTMHTVHAGLDNRTEYVRLSSDTRYQPAHLPADERWVGANPTGHGRAGKRGRVC